MNWDIDMSGPIVRRYGFPNFEKIFGKRPLEHGADEPESAERPTETKDADSNPAGQTPTEKGREPERRSH
jgi:hypothetical protein